MDLFIATYALAHSVPVLTLDADFAAIQRAGVGLVLARPSWALGGRARFGTGPPPSPRT